MAVILLCSATGAPGVTTTALGLTLTWPRDVLLADCDRDAGQAVLAGYLQGHDAAGCGLLEVAREHRQGRRLGTDLVQRSLPLAETPVRRRFLPGFTRPATAALFAPVWASLADAFAELSAAGIDVVIDLGRIGATGLPRELVQVAQHVLLCTRTTLRALAAARLHWAQLTEQVEGSAGSAAAGLLLVGEGHPYRASEIADLFGEPVTGTVAFDRIAARALSDGAATRRRLERSALMRSCGQLAGTLSEQTVLEVAR